jgi:hypothetical protein
LAQCLSVGALIALAVGFFCGRYGLELLGVTVVLSFMSTLLILYSVSLNSQVCTLGQDQRWRATGRRLALGIACLLGCYVNLSSHRGCCATPATHSGVGRANAWVDALDNQMLVSTNFSAVVHACFSDIFVCETWLINVLLLVALAAAMAALTAYHQQPHVGRLTAVAPTSAHVATTLRIKRAGGRRHCANSLLYK